MFFELMHLKEISAAGKIKTKHITKKVIFKDTRVADFANKPAACANPIYAEKQWSKYAADKILKCTILLRSILSNLFILMTN